MKLFTNKFDEDLDLLIDKIERQENFSFARYADGELAVIENKKITGCDGWSVTDEDVEFGRDLLNSCNHVEDNYFYGISCPCCDPIGNNKLRNIFSKSISRLTYSNLFVNSNWEKAYNYFKSKDKILVCNSTSKMPEPFYKVPNNVLQFYRSGKDNLKLYYENIASNHSNSLFCISAGPLAEIIIHWMYTTNPHNQYIDVGSCLDPLIHGRATRDYHKNIGSNKVCKFF